MVCAMGCSSATLSRQYCKTPDAFSDWAFWVTGLSSERAVSRMAVIFFFTLPASPVATIR